MAATPASDQAGARRPVVVVPCYNEAGRLDEAELLRMADRVDVWLVDDGSRDSTRQVIQGIASASRGTVSARRNDVNRGKAETVRFHMLAACQQDAPVVGFFDADLATPVNEMFTMLDLLDSAGAEAVTGARVGLSGRDIQRSGARHYAGRVFSTIASLAIGTTYYDTQCGAKIFRHTPSLRAALSEPFVSRWSFDVELLGRLLAGSPGVPPVPAASLIEYPLQRWHDIAGSKLTLADAWTAFLQLVIIWRDLARRRKR
jgi:dolichyl-phosphate beta-glucosyltransferase